MTKRSWPVLTTAAATVVLAGCSSSLEYGVSVPVVAGAVAKIEDSGRTTVTVGEVSVGILCLDVASAKSHWYGTYSECCLVNKYTPLEIPPLMIQFEIRARVPGYSFDPMQVGLRTHEGRVLHPIAYVGPGRVTTAPQNLSRSCEPLRAPSRGLHPFLAPSTDSVPYDLPTDSVCFVVRFDTTITAPGDGTLLLQGIARAGQPQDLLTYPLVRRAAKSNLFTVRPDALEPSGR